MQTILFHCFRSLFQLCADLELATVEAQQMAVQARQAAEEAARRAEEAEKAAREKVYSW